MTSYIGWRRFNPERTKLLTLDGDVLRALLSLVISVDALDTAEIDLTRAHHLGDMYYSLCFLTTKMGAKFFPATPPEQMAKNFPVSLMLVKRAIRRLLPVYYQYINMDQPFDTIEFTDICQEVISHMWNLCFTLETRPQDVIQLHEAHLRLRHGEEWSIAGEASNDMLPEIEQRGLLKWNKSKFKTRPAKGGWPKGVTRAQMAKRKAIRRYRAKQQHHM